MNKINKTIHYCWFGKGEKNELIKKCIDSWKLKCPDYEIVEWNEENFDININQYVKEAYQEKKYAFVSDYARLWIIYNYGGIYLDVDVELIKSLDLLLNYECFFSCENQEYIATGLGFGSIPKNNIIKKLMEDYEKINFINNNEYDLTPCPIRNSKTIREYTNYHKKISEKIVIENIVILPSEFLCPYNYETGKMNITNNTIGIHWYGASWLTNSERKVIETKRRLSKYGLIGKFIYYFYKFLYLLFKDNKLLKKTIKNRIKKGDTNEQTK